MTPAAPHAITVECDFFNRDLGHVVSPFAGMLGGRVQGDKVPPCEAGSGFLDDGEPIIRWDHPSKDYTPATRVGLAPSVRVNVVIAPHSKLFGTFIACHLSLLLLVTRRLGAW